MTVKDSHPLPRICETLESLAGAAHYTTMDMNSGFWQVPMAADSKQHTAFTLGSMGLYECEDMPFGLCIVPPTFQRLMQNCLGELNLTYCLVYLDDVIIFSDTEEEHLHRMRVVFDRFREHGLKLKPSKCDMFRNEINYLAHHVSKNGVLPSKKNLEAIAECSPPDTYTKIKAFVGLVGHYRRFIKGFAHIAAPLYDLTSGENKDKKKEHVDLTPEAREAFDTLKVAYLQAPILAFPDFDKPFLLEMDASGKGLGAVLSQKQDDRRYHPIAYASRVMNPVEQKYHSNKQEFLALKWAVTEQFHEYLTPYGKNRNEFTVRTDNNPLTYIFSTASLDAARQRWVAKLANYNFSLEYQKGQDNMIADFLSHLDDRLPEGNVQDYLSKIPYPGVKAILDNATTPLKERAELGIRPTADGPVSPQQERLVARPARFATTNVTDWKLEQKEDSILYQVVKHRKGSHNDFQEALTSLTDRKSIDAFVKSKDRFVLKNSLLYRKYVVAYVVKDQTARTAAETLRNGYFGLFGAPAYLVSDQGKAFTSHLISNLCELYGVQKLRTSLYHAQMNSQVERMNQTIIRMIGKLDEDKKAKWSEHLLEIMLAYNGTRSAVTGFSPYFLIFGRKSRMPVDYLFPTIHDPPHQTRMEVSVAAMQKRLKEAFAVARQLSAQEAAKQQRYYD